MGIFFPELASSRLGNYCLLIRMLNMFCKINEIHCLNACPYLSHSCLGGRNVWTANRLTIQVG